ncbi:MAG: hypothetical protein ACXVCM_04580, partial [Ktedonobacteraceae bacterium]
QRAKEGQTLPRSFGIPRAGARRPQSLSETTQEPVLLARRGHLEAWKCSSEPPLLQHGEPSASIHAIPSVALLMKLGQKHVHG